jgi:hypothetical protein
MTNGGGFQVDPAVLARHAGEFPGYADRAGAIHRQLADTLAELGDCWGDDPAGRSFAAGHVQAAGTTLTGLGALPARLADVGDRFTATANGYTRADDDSADRLPTTD